MDFEQTWRSRTDEEVLAAADQLADYSEDGDQAIRRELQRRGIPGPPPAVGACKHCGRSIPVSHPGTRCRQCGEELPSELIIKTNDVDYIKHQSPGRAIVLSGLLVWPVWFALFFGLAVAAEEVLGWKAQGPKWVSDLIAISFVGIGFFLWKVVGGIVFSRQVGVTPRGKER